MIDANLWIVVKNTPDKRDPRSAAVDFVADVTDYISFEKMLKENNQIAYRARSYGHFFPHFKNAVIKKI